MSTKILALPTPLQRPSIRPVQVRREEAHVGYGKSQGCHPFLADQGDRASGIVNAGSDQERSCRARSYYELVSTQS